MAAKIKIYLKQGNLNYQERNFIRDIEDALEKKGISKDKVSPATSFSELQKMHAELCATDVEFTEVAGSKTDASTESGSSDDKTKEDQHTEFRDAAKSSIEKPAEVADVEKKKIIDPFNKEEPIIRDYVVNGDSLKDPGEYTTKKTTFEEPTSFGEAFEIPEDNEEQPSGGGKGGGDKKQQSEKKTEKTEKAQPLNPGFDDMSTAKKKKSTKKMARAIIEGACKLAEFGSVWWVTKDITDAKVLEYERADSIDVNILLSLEGGQQATVKAWFASQVKDANTLLKVSEPEKDDLVDSLYEVMLEKGIAPSPMQELMINAVSSIVIGLGVRAFAMSTQINNVLNQLMDMRKDEKKREKAQRREDEMTAEAERDKYDFENASSHNKDEEEEEEDKVDYLDKDEAQTGLTVID